MTNVRICTCLPGVLGPGRRCDSCIADDTPGVGRHTVTSATIGNRPATLHLDGEPFPYRTVGGARVKHGPDEFTRIVVEILVDGPVTVQP